MTTAARYCTHLLKVSNRFRLGRYLSNIWRADNVAIVAHKCVVLYATGDTEEIWISLLLLRFPIAKFYLLRPKTKLLKSVDDADF